MNTHISRRTHRNGFKYEYGSFDERVSSTGTMAEGNPFRYSTKYCDSETDLVYYGYHYYSPALGRWFSRDPIEEKGGLNLYGFVGNDPVNNWDKLGKVEGGIITIGEIPEVAKELDKLYKRLSKKGINVGNGVVSTTEIWGGFVASTFMQLYAQAIYDQIQENLETVIPTCLVNAIGH